MANYKLVQNSNGYVFSSEVDRDSSKMTTPLNGSNLKFTYADRTDNTREQANLFSSFRLPITANQKLAFNSAFGVNYAPKFLNQDVIILAEIPKDEYGELVDGKSIKFEFPTTGGTVDIYGTYSEDTGFLTSAQTYTSDPEEGLVTGSYKLGVSKSDPVSGAQVNPPASNPTNIPYKSNVCLLFSDTIATPVGGGSWATGWGPQSSAPYSVGGKKRYDFENNGGTPDQPVGIALLDSGFIVITDPTLTHDFDVTGAFNADGTPYAGGTTDFADIYFAAGSSLHYETINTEYLLSVLCVAGAGEFTDSKNGTFIPGTHTDVKVTEIALYGENATDPNLPGELLAYGKLDRPVTKGPNDFVSFVVQIKA